jgi:hypothetical protein
MPVSSCKDALVLATYNSFSTATLDWRLAQYVSDSVYNEVKNEAGGNAVIYGFPVGADYNDFKKRVDDKVATHQESLTSTQATNVMWTGLDPGSVSVYSKCLDAQAQQGRGLHLTVRHATKRDIALTVRWTPQGNDPTTISVQWSPAVFEGLTLPVHFTAGDTVVIVPRPTEQQSLAIVCPGFSDTLVVEPYPPLPVTPVYLKQSKISLDDFYGVAANPDDQSPQRTYLCSGFRPGADVIATVVGKFRIDGGGGWLMIEPYLNNDFGGRGLLQATPGGSDAYVELTGSTRASNVRPDGSVQVQIYVRRAQGETQRTASAAPGSVVVIETD